jgi:DUF971 family protein
MSGMEAVEPSDVTVERDQAVTVTFADGKVCRFDLESLRAACPCATCRNYRDRGEPAWPRPGRVGAPTITDARFVGAWGLGITWDDGHATGIYPWESLYRWGGSGGSGHE